MAAAPKNRVLVGERVSRAAVDAARAPDAHSEAAVREAIARCDYDAAAARVIARARAGEAVPMTLVAEVVPGLEWWPVACALLALGAGDRAAALVAALADRRFPPTRDALDLEAIVLFAAHRAGAPAAQLVTPVRRLAARTGTVEGYALIATVAAAIDDPHVTAACKPIAGFAKEGAASVVETERALAATLEQILAALPAEVEDSAGAGMTVRAAKPAGRNDPCPCGSGNKYKKCCADKQVVGAPSPIPGVTWDAFLTTSADQMTVDHVAELPLRDLARVDLGRLASPPLGVAAHRFALARAWAHAERALDLLVARGADARALADDAAEELALSAHECGRRELQARAVAALSDGARAGWALDLAIAAGPAEAWRALVAGAEAAVSTEDPGRHADLAYSLLREAPALGILAARACIGGLHVSGADDLLDAVEEIRDHRNLPPSDRAWTALDTLVPPTTARKHGKAPAAASPEAEARELRDALRAVTARADAQDRELAALRAELSAARLPTPAELQRREPEARDRATALEAKVAELEALIREGNAERRELRRALAASAPEEPAPVVAAAAAGDPDDALGDVLPLQARPVAIPRFEKRALAAFGDVPTTIAAEAMRTVGALAAGDFPAWRGVKQAKDMPTTVLMARVGIHHRLILRSDGASLEVLDLVTREQLMTTLKRLRANL